MSVSRVEPPVFGLADIPDDWEIRLRQDFVDELDRINRPWAYEDPPKPGQGRRTVYWRISTNRKRTLEKFTPEELKEYKKECSFYERLWGWKRKPWYKRSSSRWIRKWMISILRKGITIEDSELEKVIIGLRAGGSNVHRREILFDRLPIFANKWWAWLLGYYYSVGAINFRPSRPERQQYREGIYVYLRTFNPVIPLVMRVASKVGVKPKISDRKQDRVVLKLKTKGLRTTRRVCLLLGWPEYLVLSKFGLSTEFREESPGVVSRSWKPRIDDWVKVDDECMRFFFEGFINGGRCASSFSIRERSGRLNNIALMVMVRMSAAPGEYAERFCRDLYTWVVSKGLSAYFREFKFGYKRGGKKSFEFNLCSRKAFEWLMSSFEIARPDLRARLVARLESYDDPVILRILQELKSPHNVILGMLLESPLTLDDLDHALQMRKDGVVDCLVSLVKRGIIERRGAHYFYQPEEFVRRLVERKQEDAELLARRMERYSSRLLNQCEECGRVYVVERAECGLCGGAVEPVERMKVMRRLNLRRVFLLKDVQALQELVA